MDSDPCAAPRIQIVTKTSSDLTAFELAGGDLGETIIIVSTVCSNSHEQARTVVKNLARQKMLDVIAHRVRCDICDVACYGKEGIKRHYEGIKHMENVQKLPVSMKEKTAPPVANAKLHQECEKNVRDLLLNEVPVNSFSVCDIPDLASFHSQNIVTKDLEDNKTGGNLGEPSTKVSTTPRSLAHAQPIVHDEIKTQTQTETFHRDSCDLFCYDVEGLKRRKRNTHFQNSKMLPVTINQKTPPLFANDIVANSLFVCKIPDDETFQNQNIFTKYLEGKQAGGTLNKPTTIVSTATAPFAYSKIDAPHTVTDVVVTNKESENGNFIVCDVCNLTCNSQTDFNIHKKGKKHLKNTQKFLVLSSAIKQETPSSVAKEAKQDLLQKEGTSANPLLVCNIPYQPTYLNQNNVTEIPLFDGTLTASEELNIRQPPRCEVCKITYCCHKCLGIHISGEQHLQNLRNLEKNMSSPSIESNKIPNFPLNIITSVAKLPNDPAGKAVNLKESDNVRCEICDITCVSPDQLKEHISGIKHTKNLRKSMLLNGQSSNPAAKQSLPNPLIKEGKFVFADNGKWKTTSPNVSDSEDSITKREKPMEDEVESGVRVMCRVCHVACNSIMAFNSHLASFEHHAMVSKQINLG